MSYFYSDLINWSAATLAGTACLIVGADAALLKGSDVTRADTGTVTEQVILTDTNTLTVNGAANGSGNGSGAILLDGVLIRDALAEPVAPVAVIEPVRQATLETVVFTATGNDQSSLAPLTAEPLGRVTGNSVNLRAGPGTSFAVIGRATQDQELVVTGQTDGIWIEIKTPLGQETGWVHGNYFMAVN